MSWNDERVELLKKLWSEGLSASQIAGRIGSVTRNAVIGKVHRLGLSGRATTSRMKSHRPRPRANPVRKLAKPKFANVGNTAVRNLFQADPAEPYVPPVEELVIPLAERKTIQEKIQTLNKEREAYVSAEPKKLGEGSGLDVAMVKAIRTQAQKQQFTFPAEK